jgi:hypothetical protein
MFKNTRIVYLCVAVLGLCVAQTALAEPTAQTTSTENGDYSYRFSDEDLLGGTLNNVGDMYRWRPKTARVMLLRPRVSLVQEILKSAENL